MKYRVVITYCSQCNWLLRAAWMAQEILSTFPEELSEVALSPGKGGIYEIRLNDRLIFSRKNEGRFPEAKEVKSLIRDIVNPERHLGHSDVRKSEQQ